MSYVVAWIALHWSMQTAWQRFVSCILGLHATSCSMVFLFGDQQLSWPCVRTYHWESQQLAKPGRIHKNLACLIINLDPIYAFVCTQVGDKEK
jgi:hypothetical protein